MAFLKQIKVESDDSILVDVKVERMDDELEDQYSTDVENKIVNIKQELYEDHVIKEELVIGPETFQKPEQNLRILKKEKTRILKSEINFKPKKPSASKRKSNVITKKEEYKCDHCHKVYEKRSSIQAHMAKHTVGNIICSVCGKNFSFAQNLKRHIRQIHSKPESYKCTQCDKSFSRSDYLSRHIKTNHSLNKLPKKTFSCELCNKEFTKNTTCNYHLRYVCPNNKNKMVQTIKRKLRWYTCDVCDRSYPYRCSLSAHIVKRHMARTKPILHECDYCAKQYVKKHNLQCHVQWKHMKIKPYSCKKCKETFIWHSTLLKHEREKHGKANPKKKMNKY